MRDYFYIVEIPANTSADNPLTVDCPVEGDELRRIAYLIPPGWHALAGFAVYFGIEQIYPERKGEWVTGDNVYRQVELRWKMPARRLLLNVQAYNNDGQYPHKLFIWFSTIDFEEDKLTYISSMLERIMEWLGL